MGTRADFYVGRGQGAEWLGSVAWDGYPIGIDREVLTAKTEAAFRAAVTACLTGRDDATLPADGWPWPWDDSQTTDYAYAFADGAVHGACFGCGWFDPLAVEPQVADTKVDFPNMKSRSSLTFGPRSGVMVLGLRGPAK